MGAVRAYIGLGANLGDANQALQQALLALCHASRIRVTRVSSLYRTAALDEQAGVETLSPEPDYLNAVVEVETELNASMLLKTLQAIEHAAGRERPHRNAPRTLDLDLLLFGEGQIHSKHLTVPHPRMYQRAFVLVPLAEIAPTLVSAESLQAIAWQPVSKAGVLITLDAASRR